MSRSRSQCQGPNSVDRFLCVALVVLSRCSASQDRRSIGQTIGANNKTIKTRTHTSSRAREVSRREFCLSTTEHGPRIMAYCELKKERITYSVTTTNRTRITLQRPNGDTTIGDTTILRSRDAFPFFLEQQQLRFDRDGERGIVGTHGGWSKQKHWDACLRRNNKCNLSDGGDG
uniref:Putative secreted protein n=1 Tax=Anopheles darlingi TaxID=43151 RepID=A0A2M4D2H0_ANODA